MSYEKFMKIKRHLDLKAAMEAFIEKDYQKAIDLYTTVLKSDPNDWKVYIQRSNCYQQLNQLEEALKDTQTVVTLSPNQLSGHYRKGVVLLEQKKFRLAEESFQTALSLDPTDENSLIKLKETHQLFLKEFGFKDNETDVLMTKYTSCVGISDALISGQLIEMLAEPQLMPSPETESFCMESLQQSLEKSVCESNLSLNNTTIGDNDPIRRPKTDPLFKRNSMSPKTNAITIPKNISTPESANASPVSMPSQSKLVKTRPVITRSIIRT